MRFFAHMLLLLAFLPCAMAQQQEKSLMDRLDAKWDMSQVNSMDGKKFTGGKSFDPGKKAQVDAFLYDQKIAGQKYENVRSFLGIKNPWIGKKVETSQASLWTKTLISNADRKVDVGTTEVRPFYQAGKGAAHREDPIRTTSFDATGGAQGAVSQMAPALKKNLTIDDVREILNKNH